MRRHSPSPPDGEAARGRRAPQAKTPRPNVIRTDFELPDGRYEIAYERKKGGDA
jgi:hypothetical protein